MVDGNLVLAYWPSHPTPPVELIRSALYHAVNDGWVAALRDRPDRLDRNHNGSWKKYPDLSHQLSGRRIVPQSEEEESNFERDLKR